MGVRGHLKLLSEYGPTLEQITNCILFSSQLFRHFFFGVILSFILIFLLYSQFKPIVLVHCVDISNSASVSLNQWVSFEIVNKEQITISASLLHLGHLGLRMSANDQRSFWPLHNGDSKAINFQGKIPSYFKNWDLGELEKVQRSKGDFFPVFPRHFSLAWRGAVFAE